MHGDFQLGEWLVQPLRDRIESSASSVPIEPKAMDLLVYLARHADQVVSKDQLISEVWEGAFVTEEVLTNSIYKLRQALGDDSKDPRFIQNVPRRGYQLIASVEFLQTDEKPSLPEDKAGSGSRIAALGTAGGRSRLAWAAGLSLVILSSVVAWFAIPDGTPRVALGEITSVAVLPLDNLVRDPAQDFFVDGMTEAIIAELSRVSSLKVISLTSAMRFKETELSMPEIARELGADAIIEGGVSRAGGKVRITARLVHGKKDEYLWSRSYVRDLKDIFELQSDVARDIAREIRAALPPEAVRASIRRIKLENIEAYESYLRGRHLWHKRTQKDNQRAIEYFQRAVELQSDFALAHAGLAHAYVIASAWYWMPFDEAIPLAERAARRALELDESLAEAHAALGGVLDSSFDSKRAEHQYRRAISLNPNYAMAHFWLSEVLTCQGRFEEALRETETAQELDPYSPIIAAWKGRILFYARRYEEAVQELKQAMADHPRHGYAEKWLARAYAWNGMADAAIDFYSDFLRATDRDPEKDWTILEVKAIAGREEEIRTALAAWSEEEIRPSPTGELGSKYSLDALMGNKEAAFAWLDEAYRQKAITLTRMKVDPAWDFIRDDPRFQDLLRKVGLDP